MQDFILKGDIVYSRSLTELETQPNAYVICREGRSAGVFTEIPEEYAGLPLLDYSGHLVIPGMIDLHMHAPQYSFRGLGMDYELMEWLQVEAFPEETKFRDPDYADRAYGILAEQLKKSATTRGCFFGTRHREATEQLMDKLEAIGLVTYVGKVNMDREAPDSLREADAATSLAETRRWIAETKDRYQYTKPILTPRFLPSCTDELLEGLREIEAETRIPVQSHLSENPGEIAFVAELFPKSRFYGDGYDQFGLFGNYAKTIMAHCVWSGEEEIELMKQNGVFVAHCPDSNMCIASGIAPIRKYLERGLHVGLGSDVAGGVSESLFRAVTQAIQVSKLYWRHIDQSLKPLTFDEAFYLATRGGGEFFGKVGSFEEGFEFDAVVLDESLMPHPQELTLHERAERSFYLQADLIGGICAKFVQGRKVY